MPKEQSHSDTVIARPPLTNRWKPHRSIAPPRLRCQKSALLNKLSESDWAQSTQALLQPKSSGDLNAPQPKASSHKNIPQNEKATFEVAKRFMEAIPLMNIPELILSDDKYSMVKEARKLAIKAQHHQRALAGAPAGTPSLCQLPSGPSLRNDPQTQEAVSIGFCWRLLYQICNIVNAPNDTYLKFNISTIRGRLADVACQPSARSYPLKLHSEPEHLIKVEKLLLDDAYLSDMFYDESLSFTWMKLPDLNYHEITFTANSLGHQPTRPQYFKPLALQTLALAAAGIHCTLSEWGSGKKAMVMFCQDEYWGTFCPSPETNFNP